MIRHPLALLAAAAFVLPSPASAHSGSNAVENLRTEVASVPDGLEAQVRSDGSLITVRARPGVGAVVRGYEGEPFLRLEGDSAFTNAASSTTRDLHPEMTEVTGVAGVAGVAGADWQAVEDPGWFAWSDHRVLWDGERLPAAVMDDPGDAHRVATWSIPVTVDGHDTAITGRIVWDPPAGGQGFTVVVLVGLLGLALSLAVWAAFPRRVR